MPFSSQAFAQSVGTAASSAPLCVGGPRRVMAAVVVAVVVPV